MGVTRAFVYKHNQCVCVCVCVCVCSSQSEAVAQHLCPTGSRMRSGPSAAALKTTGPDMSAETSTVNILPADGGLCF